MLDVSLAVFQSLLARLVTSPDLRRDLAADGEAAIAGLDLTPAERRRAVSLAADRGVRVTATLVESFRLGKILRAPAADAYVAGRRSAG